jgi:hypothetical protein
VKMSSQTIETNALIREPVRWSATRSSPGKDEPGVATPASSPV